MPKLKLSELKDLYMKSSEKFAKGKWFQNFDFQW